MESRRLTPMESVAAVPGTYRLLPLTVEHSEKRLLVAPSPCPSKVRIRPVATRCSRTSPRSFFQAGDVGTVRSGPDDAAPFPAVAGSGLSQ